MKGMIAIRPSNGQRVQVLTEPFCTRTGIVGEDTVYVYSLVISRLEDGDSIMIELGDFLYNYKLCLDT